MLHATEVLGAETYDSNGNFVGRVKELFIEPAEQPNRVARILLGRGKFRPLVARFDQVSFVAPGTIKLNVDERVLLPYEPNEAWLAVRKDLLDQQIIDTNGRKVVRVNDIDLIEERINGTMEMRVTHVDVGLPGAVRRLLEGVVSPGAIRRIQKNLPTKTIKWEFVNLIEPDPMRRVKLRMTSQKLEKLHPADLADIMEDLSPAEREAIISSVDEETAAEALAELDARLQAQIVEKMDPEKAADIIEEMAPDEAADLLAELPQETSEGILDDMEAKEAEEIEELLEYKEDTAGGMMNPDFIAVPQSGTVDTAIAALRANREVAATVNTVFVTDGENRLTGSIPLVDLFLASPSALLHEIKPPRLLFAHLDSSEKDVIELFDKYNLLSLPVVDELYRIDGVITVDDIISVLRAKK